MRFSAVLCAQSFAGSGVGATATGLGDEPAGWLAPGVPAPAEGAADWPGPHAANARTAVIARAGNL